MNANFDDVDYWKRRASACGVPGFVIENDAYLDLEAFMKLVLRFEANKKREDGIWESAILT